MKSVIAHAILALGGLTLAYVVWTDQEPTQREEEVTVIDCDADRLSKVRLVAPDHEVTIERRDTDGETLWWITSGRIPEEGEPTSEQFVGNDAAVETLLGLLAPLNAKRDLGSSLSDEILEELELKDSESRLTISCGGRDTELTVGGSAFGSGDRYLSSADGSIYLVDARLLRDVEAPTGLMQRELHTFEMTEVHTLTVSAFDRSVRLLQRNRLDPRQAEWVDATAPDRRNELYSNWLTRVERLRVQTYLAPRAEPGSDMEETSVTPSPLATLTYGDEDGEELGRTELVRVDGGEQPEYYARSEATRSWVKVLASLGQQVERDLRPVVGLEEIIEESPTPADGEGDAGQEAPGDEEDPAAGVPAPGGLPGAPPGQAPAPGGQAPAPGAPRPGPAPGAPRQAPGPEGPATAPGAPTRPPRAPTAPDPQAPPAAAPPGP